MKSIWFLFAITIGGSIFAQQKKNTAAVLSFVNSGGVDKNEISILTDRFSNYLVNTDAYTVLERDKMDAILKAQDFNMSDNCSSAECAVQIGQLLGVELMFAGKVGQFGQLYTIDIRIIDVTSGKIIKTKSENYEGKKEGLLNMIEALAYTVSGKTPPVRAYNEMPISSGADASDEIRIGTVIKRYGSMEIVCEMDGILFIDDKQIGEVFSGSIIPVENLRPGNYTVRITGKDGEYNKSVRVEYDKKISLTAKGSRVVGYMASRSNMVLMKAGTFTMGSESGDPDEKPTRRVSVGSFYIGRYEVTQKEWVEIMGSNPSYFSGCEDCPVEKVSWKDVQTFIAKLNEKTKITFRLPTEAEWEYAARGNLDTSNGPQQDLSSTAWFMGNSNGKTHAVGEKSPNANGLYDMTGNVWEWCADWYGPYSGTDLENPTGPKTGTGRVLRGGSWNSEKGTMRPTNRNRNSPEARDVITGFRLCVTAE